MNVRITVSLVRVCLFLSLTWSSAVRAQAPSPEQIRNAVLSDLENFRQDYNFWRSKVVSRLEGGMAFRYLLPADRQAFVQLVKEEISAYNNYKRYTYAAPDGEQLVRKTPEANAAGDRYAKAWATVRNRLEDARKAIQQRQAVYLEELSPRAQVSALRGRGPWNERYQRWRKIPTPHLSFIERRMAPSYQRLASRSPLSGAAGSVGSILGTGVAVNLVEQARERGVSRLDIRETLSSTFSIASLRATGGAVIGGSLMGGLASALPASGMAGVAIKLTAAVVGATIGGQLASGHLPDLKRLPFTTLANVVGAGIGMVGGSAGMFAGSVAGMYAGEWLADQCVGPRSPPGVRTTSIRPDASLALPKSPDLVALQATGSPMDLFPPQPSIRSDGESGRVRRNQASADVDELDDLKHVSSPQSPGTQRE